MKQDRQKQIEFEIRREFISSLAGQARFQTLNAAFFEKRGTAAFPSQASGSRLRLAAMEACARLDAWLHRKLAANERRDGALGLTYRRSDKQWNENDHKQGVRLALSLNVTNIAQQLHCAALESATTQLLPIVERVVRWRQMASGEAASTHSSSAERNPAVSRIQAAPLRTQIVRESPRVEQRERQTVERTFHLLQREREASSILIREFEKRVAASEVISRAQFIHRALTVPDRVLYQSSLALLAPLAVASLPLPQLASMGATIRPGPLVKTIGREVIGGDVARTVPQGAGHHPEILKSPARDVRQAGRLPLTPRIASASSRQAGSLPDSFSVEKSAMAAAPIKLTPVERQMARLSQLIAPANLVTGQRIRLTVATKNQNWATGGDQGNETPDSLPRHFVSLRRAEMAEPEPLRYSLAQPPQRRTMAEESAIKTVEKREVVEIVQQEVKTLMAKGSPMMKLARADYERIADQVYSALAGQLLVERERLGARF